MAGKKKAPKDQRLSVFQPAFKWGSSSGTSSSSSSNTKNEVKKKEKDDKIKALNSKIEPSIDDNIPPKARQAPDQKPEQKTSRAEKRMTTFQPAFSLFTKSPKAKGLQQSQFQPLQAPARTQASEKPRNGLPPQQPSRGEPLQYAAANNASGVNRDVQAGPSQQEGALWNSTQGPRGSDPRKQNAVGPGRNGPGDQTTVHEFNNRPPVQRNPASSVPERQPISKAFGAGGRSNGQAFSVGNVPANSADSRLNKNNVPRGQDHSLSSEFTSKRGTPPNDRSLQAQGLNGVDTQYNQAATKRERHGLGFQRGDPATANPVLLANTPNRKLVASNVDAQADLNARQLSDANGAPESGRPMQRKGPQRQDIPPLPVTNTNDKPALNLPPTRPTRQLRTQEPLSAIAMGKMPAWPTSSRVLVLVGRPGATTNPREIVGEGFFDTSGGAPLAA